MLLQVFVLAVALAIATAASTSSSTSTASSTSSTASTSPAARIRPIRVALSIDNHSLKDVVILLNSVIESALDPQDLVFHLVACGKDIMSAMLLKREIKATLELCLPGVRHELVAFTLPKGGFSSQLQQLKRKSNHWNSASGADMVRFFLPSLFSHTERLLYLDNDVVVSCCLEEVFDTPLQQSQVVGVALDDLNWATVTQFQRHYNASHPLVVQNMRRGRGADAVVASAVGVRMGAAGAVGTVGTEEFSKALPRYPNDGVLLIDVQKWNKQGILEIMDELAAANGRGEYAVNLGE
ncbi:hypothetical protein B484DRAFT_96590 [Ochromonadaceae sp. CCMP2298]|nr:hypothetical protein B484DRAFT_96590 [Ochromonadaceae sp. CCMP2298]